MKIGKIKIGRYAGAKIFIEIDAGREYATTLLTDEQAEKLVKELQKRLKKNK